MSDMDAMGVGVQVLSVTSSGVQALKASEAGRWARDANDELARLVEENPTRYACFATLPSPGPAAAAEELER